MRRYALYRVPVLVRYMRYSLYLDVHMCLHVYRTSMFFMKDVEVDLLKYLNLRIHYKD